MSSSAPTTTAGTSCRVIVVDDHTIMRDGLSAILDGEPHLEVVGTAADGKAAVAEVDRLVPDIVNTVAITAVQAQAEKENQK